MKHKSPFVHLFVHSSDVASDLGMHHIASKLCKLMRFYEIFLLPNLPSSGRKHIKSLEQHNITTKDNKMAVLGSFCTFTPGTPPLQPLIFPVSQLRQRYQPRAAVCEPNLKTNTTGVCGFKRFIIQRLFKFIHIP